MKNNTILLLALHLALCTLHSPAAVPLKWTVETSRVQPVVFDAVRGETLALEASFKSYGTDVSTSNLTASLYWQTNGMASAWWVTNAVTSGTSASVLFTPEMDPGASTVQAFLAISTTNTTLSSTHYPLSSLSYRAAFTLRFRHGPGASPNAIAAPVPILDLANTVVVNPPWPTTNDFITATNLMQTALKEYVDSEIEGAGVVSPQTVTNIVDAKIAAIPKDGISTNAVSGIITNHVESGYLCTVAAADGKYLKSESGFDSYLEWDGLDLVFKGYGGCFVLNAAAELKFNAGNQTLPSYLASGEWNTASDPFTTYSTVTNLTTAATNGITASSIGAYPSASGEQLATQVESQGAFLNAEDAKAVVTNYDSTTNLREMDLRIKLTEGGSNVWRSIWREMDRWNAFTGTNFNWSTWGGFWSWSTNLSEIVGYKCEREYAFYDGVTGGAAPDGFFWISQPKIAVCAGAAYQRYVESGGTVWLLESNGLVADINGTTNGFFRITDEEGNSQFEIVKGDKTTVVATCGSMVQTNILGVTHWYCQYAVTNAVAAPTAKFCRDLANPTWYADTDASCPMNVSWTAGLNNTYNLEFWEKSSEPKMVVKSEYQRGGETRIKQSVPVEMQYIILNGTKYSLTPKTVDGELVMGLTQAN